MPRKNGNLTRQERAVAEAFAESGSQYVTALAAGVSQSGASRALQRPAVQAEIIRLQTERLTNDLLPLAVNAVSEILTNAKAPAGARIQAAKLVFDRTLGAQAGLGDKEPHEMSGSELADAIAKLEAMAAARAKPVEAEVIEDKGIFD